MLASTHISLAWTTSGNSAVFAQIKDPNNNIAIRKLQYVQELDTFLTACQKCTSTLIPTAQGHLLRASRPRSELRQRGSRRTTSRVSWERWEAAPMTPVSLLSPERFALCKNLASGSVSPNLYTTISMLTSDYSGFMWWGAGPWWGTVSILCTRLYFSESLSNSTTNLWSLLMVQRLPGYSPKPSSRSCKNNLVLVYAYHCYLL